MIAEGTFWRSVAGVLGLALAVCVVANLVHEEAVPHEITLLIFGSLVALGIGNALLNPATSPVLLTEQEETRFRRRQYVAGFVMSTILVLLIVFTELRGSLLVWLLAPIIVLPFVLVARERLKKD